MGPRVSNQTGSMVRDQEDCLGWLVTFAPLRFISTDKRDGPSTIIAHYNGINGAAETCIRGS